MFNLHNKIITVIFTLITMINYCNGYITDKNVILDKKNFTTEEIKTWEQFKEESSKYLINNLQYFHDRKENYYTLIYNFYGNPDTHAPDILYKLETVKKLNIYKDCKHDVLYFEHNQKHLTLALKDIRFFKPIDTFVQPPELRDADDIGVVTTCEEFNDKVIRVHRLFNVTNHAIWRSRIPL